MIPVLTLIDDDSNSYTFPADFWPTDYPIVVNKSVRNFTFAAGGRNTSDGYPQARTFNISGMLRADSLAALETKKRAFVKAVMKGGKLQYSDDVVSRYIDIRSPDLNFSVGGWRFSENVDLSFICENPFWVDAAETVSTNILTGDDTIYVDLSGSDFLVFPIIEIDNDQAVDNPTVKMYNVTDGSGAFEYNDAAFVVDDVLTIDSALGTVEKNSNDAFEDFSPARFLRLRPENNQLEYEGAAATVKIKYRKVYAI